jgi:diaminohydroxyphosphoribosylaminopyrimidine deaminase/5-amino-6-(5-phosphoribosylamino)uracil reductase
MTRSGNLPGDAILFTDEHRDRTLVYQGIDWLDMLKALGAKGVTRLLVEGGGDILGQLHDLRLLDELWCFVTPMLTAGNKPSFAGRGVERMADASRLHRIRYKRLGDDVLVTGYIR